ncbi:hypothetical protein [Pseudonocardia thermophila]|uniref:hypothetical protein n=1 Tax=Pseudonocardia thermophila TaxID=1848 RepID=UPI00248D8968|nr:hypothetical protein [Pseudonocardia thermophila]
MPGAALRDQRVPLAELLPDLAGAATARIERGDDPTAVLLDLAPRLPGDPALPCGARRAVRWPGDQPRSWPTRSAGYAGQPHLSQEVRTLVGTSPAQLSGPNRSTPVPSGAGQGHLHVPVRLRGQSRAEQAVEGRCLRHVGDDDAGVVEASVRRAPRR